MINKFPFAITLLLFFLVAISSCTCNRQEANNQVKDEPADLSKIKIGMSAGEVQKLIGTSKQKADLGTYQDETGKSFHTEEWYYNDNQLVQLINDTVSAVILDVKGADDQIQRIIDSARNAGDTTTVLHSEGYSTE